MIMKTVTDSFSVNKLINAVISVGLIIAAET